MNKPNLIIVTGRPGSGKTTFAQKFGDTAFMQVISRDKIKEGYVHTMGKEHDVLPEDTNLAVTNVFFDTLKFLLKNNISVVAEAAFQHKVWSHMLTGFDEIANISIIICTVDDNLAFNRFISRGLDNNLRGYFHGDKGVQMVKSGMEVEVGTYTPPALNVPTFSVDTTDKYTPTIKELTRKIFDDGIVYSLLDEN